MLNNVHVCQDLSNTKDPTLKNRDTTWYSLDKCLKPFYIWNSSLQLPPQNMLLQGILEKFNKAHVWTFRLQSECLKSEVVPRDARIVLLQSRNFVGMLSGHKSK